MGAVSFVVGISGADAQRAWQVYLVNFVFWAGLCFGGVMLVAVFNMTNAHWARPLKRLAEAPGSFLPVLYGLFWVLFLGRESLFPWIHEPVHGKEAWLNVGFLFARDGGGLLVLTGASLALMVQSVRGDLLAGVQENGGSRAWRAQKILSPILGILYSLILSLVAFDLIMSLDPHWLSTLFGAYYFMGSLYTAIAAVLLLTCLLWKREGLEGRIHKKHFHDLGKLLFAFCLVTGDFFYSQFLVIWYGNMPEEVKYVILRVNHAPWATLAWTVLGVSFALPFVVLLSRRIKMNPRAMLILSVVLLGGMWLEKFLLVAPSLWKGETLPLGLMEVAVTAGFAGGMGLCVETFLRRVPALPVSDPLFLKGKEGEESA
jgi:Ni/Fe-hydrogenase subunit HybB-like protein